MNHHENDDIILKQAISQLGYDAPVTDEEIDNFETNLDKGETIPEHLCANNLVTSIMDTSSNKVTQIKKDSTEQPLSGLAMAARKGKEIPPAILEKMQRDRRNNESEEK